MLLRMTVRVHFLIGMLIVSLAIGRSEEPSELFLNAEVSVGLVIGKEMNASECIDRCDGNSLCAGMDHIESSQTCKLHTSITECRDLKPRSQVGSLHIRKISCTRNRIGQMPGNVPCNRGHGSRFYFYNNKHAFDGWLNAGNTTFQNCVYQCNREPNCYAADWNKNTRNCFFHGSSFTPQNNSCCYQVVKQCVTAHPPTTRPPTTQLPSTSSIQQTTRITTTMATTERTSPVTTTTSRPAIGDSGNCPDPLEKRVDAYAKPIFGGSRVRGVRTAEECKEYCLNHTTCAAADFFKQYRVCRIRNTSEQFEVEFDAGINIDHYRKTNCEDLVPLCILEVKYNASDPETQNVVNIHPAAVQKCPLGLCQVTFIGNMTAGTTIYRSCHCQGGFKDLGCRPHTGNLQTCVCFGSLCNTFDLATFKALAAYYPFDSHAEDRSQFQRHGQPENIAFFTVDAMKNGSAYFDGNAFVYIPFFAGIQFGNLRDHDPLTGLIVNSARLTVVLSLKRKDPSGQMSIISNRVGTESTGIAIVSEEMSPEYHSVTAMVFINGGLYQAWVEDVPINEWVFVVLILGIENADDFFLKLRVTPGGAENNRAFDPPASQPSTAQMTITASDVGFLIGAGWKYDPLGNLIKVDFLKGLVDEVWIFNDALSDEAIDSLHFQQTTTAKAIA